VNNYLKISLGIFVALAASRFVPHPPNFTSLIALSFYIPAVLGIKFLPAILISFLITDIYLGLHSTMLFTWGSVALIGWTSKYFVSKFFSRICGLLFGAFIFYLITNFGVWLNGSYGYSLEGIVTCYILAIPFFGNTIISTLIFSLIIEGTTKIIEIYNYKKYF
tara:strand:+ start:248 stop:739 length:492 start_codon:yes stop_codon:yes gene_type:complete